MSDINGEPDRIRTCDQQLRRLLLYPAELRDRSWHSFTTFCCEGHTRQKPFPMWKFRLRRSPIITSLSPGLPSALAQKRELGHVAATNGG